MDEILDGRKIGLDIAIVQNAQGAFSSLPERMVWERIANVYEERDGTVRGVYTADFSKIHKTIADTLERQRNELV